MSVPSRIRPIRTHFAGVPLQTGLLLYLAPAAALIPLLLVILLLTGTPAQAQISCVYSTSGGMNTGQSPYDGSGGTLTLSYTSSPGDIVLVAVSGWYYQLIPRYFGPPSVTSTGGSISAITGGTVSTNTGVTGTGLATYEMEATGTSGSVYITVDGSTVIAATLEVYSGTSLVDTAGSAYKTNDGSTPEATVTTVSSDDLVIGFLGEQANSETPDQPGTGYSYINGYQEPTGGLDSYVMTSCEDGSSQDYDSDTEVTASFANGVDDWFAVAVALAPS